MKMVFPVGNPGIFRIPRKRMFPFVLRPMPGKSRRLRKFRAFLPVDDPLLPVGSTSSNSFISSFGSRLLCLPYAHRETRMLFPRNADMPPRHSSMGVVIVVFLLLLLFIFIVLFIYQFISPSICQFVINKLTNYVIDSFIHQSINI